MTNEPKTIKSVEKAVQVLDLLAKHPSGLNATEIANYMEQRVSGVFHLLTTLHELGLIQQDQTKRYKLGLKLWQLGMRVIEEEGLASRLTPFLKDLRNKTGETANLTVLYGNEILYIGQESSANLLQSFTQLGATAPLHCTGSGKLLLAYMDDDKKDHVLSALRLTSYTPNTITSKSKLKAELENIRQNGIAYDHEEREKNVNCIGAPIFGYFNEVVACLSISGPSSRFTPKNQQIWTKILKDIAHKASRQLQNK